MAIINKAINNLQFLVRALGDLTGHRGGRRDLDFLQKIGEFSLVEVVRQDKLTNKFQFAIYRSENGKEYMAKQLALEKAGIDEYWLRNEISIYRTLAGLDNRVASLIAQKFPKIKIPRLAAVFEDETRLLCLTERVSGKTLFEISVEESSEYIESAINYFKFLNTVHDFGGTSITRRSFMSMLPMLGLACIGSIKKYPGELLTIGRGLAIVVINLPLLFFSGEKKLIHRDLGYGNIMINDNGDIHIIDLESSSYMHPLWEVAQAVVGCRRRAGFLEAFNKTGVMQNVMNDQKSRRLYRLFSIYCGIHLLSTAGRGPEKADSDKQYMRYALNI